MKYSSIYYLFLNIIIFITHLQYQVSSFDLRGRGYNSIFYNSKNPRIYTSEDFMIREFYDPKGRKIFVCCDRQFIVKQEAMKVCGNVKKIQDSSSQRTLLLKKNSIIQKNRNSIIEKSKSSKKKSMNSKQFSDETWLYLWKNCNAKCFSSNNFAKMISIFLIEINEYRKHHGAKPLMKDFILEKDAKHRVEEMANNNKISRRDKQMYGKNVIITSFENGPKAIKKWYEEEKFYKYGNGPVSGTQDFTQMVWKSTEKVGCAVSMRLDHLWILCEFYPKGNINKEYKANVRKFKADL